MRFTPFGTVRLTVVAAAIEMFLGLAIYVLPREFSAPIYDPLRPWFPFLSALLVAGSVVLLMQTRYFLPLRVRHALFLLPAAPLALLAGGLARSAAWSGTAFYGLLAAALLVAPWLPGAEGEETGPGLDLFGMVAGLILASVGSLMLLLPRAFATPAYAGFGGMIPLAGAAGLAGAAALLLPAARRWRGPGVWVRRLIGAALPLLMVSNFARTGVWTGVLAWGTVALALLMRSGARDSLPASRAGAAGPERDDPDPFPALERTIEGWTWLLALVVVALTALVGGAAFATPVAANLFVLAASGYNVLMHRVLPGFGPPARRVVWHLTFLTVALGFLLADTGSMGHVGLAMLVAAPPLASRALGPAAGRRMLALGLAVVALGELDGWLRFGKPAPLMLGELAVEALVLAAAAEVGIRSAGEQRRLVHDLAGAHRALARRHAELQQAHEEQQAQSEELRAQQEELQAMNEELIRQGEELLRQRDELELALESVSRAEAARARLVAILEATPDFVATADPEGRALYYNSAARRMLGMGEQEDISSVRIPDTHPEWANAIVLDEGLPAAARHGVWSGETALLSRGGREIPISQVILAHKAADGGVEYFSTIARDITERKQAEEALRESEERFRLAFGHAPIGMDLVAIDGRYLQVNQALCGMLGYPEPELLGMTYQDLTHPEDLDRDNAYVRRLLAGQIGSYQMEKRYLHRDGHVVWALLSVSLVRDRLGAPLYFIAQIQDITERKRFEAQLLHLADHDPLTDLLNRRRFQGELERQLAQARRYGRGGAILFLDLDEFKYVNDTLGHPAGDDLLSSIAALLRERVREVDVLARLGGDEFGFLLPRADAARAEAVAGRILELVRQHTVMVGGQPVGITASIGIALFPEHGSTAAEVLAHADLALYQAKEKGRNLFCTYVSDKNWEAQAESRLTWEQRIREALEQDRFVLDCQPIRNLHTGEVSQYELLLRMIGDGGEVIPPGAFLGVAERFGLIHAIDRWVVRRAIHLIAEHKRAGRTVSLAVNLSGKAFADTELLPLIQREFAATGVAPGSLVLEITETAAVADPNQARKFIETLKGLGCRFAIDDFGAGFSSFSHLKQLPVDYLKIDGSFVMNLARDPVDQHLVKAMVEVARGLGKETIAEFACDEETVRLLRNYGVDHAQGFYIGRPRAVSAAWSEGRA